MLNVIVAFCAGTIVGFVFGVLLLAILVNARANLDETQEEGDKL